MNNGDRRNPYVILGIPFGARESEARAGFAKAARRLRTSNEQPYTMEDLTWALHQVEQILEEPELALHVYRVPADEAALRRPKEGVMNPGPIRLERTSPPATDADRRNLRIDVLRDQIRRALVAHPPKLPYPYQNGQRDATPQDR